MQMLASLVQTVAFIALVAVASACALTEPYEECGFPPQEEAMCIPQSDDSPEEAQKKEASNCVIRQPQCPDNYCVSFRGSQGFCSEECETDADCPEGGYCETFIFECETDADGNQVCPKLCVKRSLID